LVKKIAKKSEILQNQFPTSNRLGTAVKGCNAAVGVGLLPLHPPQALKTVETIVSAKGRTPEGIPHPPSSPQLL